MIQKRNLWVIIGSVVLLSAILSGFVLLQNSAEDIHRILKVRRDAIRVVHNGVDTDFFDGNGKYPKEPNR